MERLHEPITNIREGVQHHLTGIKSILKNRVWSRTAFRVQPYLWQNNITDHCVSVLEDHGVPDGDIESFMKLMDMAIGNATLEFEECTIHGDPTLDNLLLRPNPQKVGIRDFVIADPIPPDRRIPNDRAVDLGKLLQSALGWESVKAGGDWRDDPLDCIKAVLKDEDYDMCCRAWFWCCVHMIRILPYARGKDDIYPHVRKMVHELVGNYPDGVRSSPRFGF